jgi:hypothetical protein
MIAQAIRLISALVSVNLATLALGGDLNPPGAPESTPGPEPRIAINAENTPGDSDSQFRITSPGSYYLTGNITLGSPVNGIEIGAGNVTLDLNGFRLGHGVFIDPPLSGIVADNGVENITVRNGVVWEFSQVGVDLSGARNTLVDQVVVSGNGGEGIWAGANCVVTRCVVEGNVGEGIYVSSHCHISGCTVVDNTSEGISVNGYGSLIEGNAVMGNGGWGIGAFITGSGNVVTGNSLSGNADGGVAFSSAAEDNVISHNIACDNSGVGFSDTSTESGNSWFGNLAVGNSSGNYQGVDLVVTSPTTTTSAWANISQ